MSEVAEHAAAIARDFKRAFTHLSAGNADAAAAVCREGLASFPDEHRSVDPARASLNAQRLADSALEPLQRALRLAPGFARAHEETGRSLLILKRLDEAISCFEKSLTLDPATINNAVRLIENQLGDTGRVILRPSGTEPLVRVTLEGPDENQVRQLAAELAEVVRASLAG